MLISYMSVGDQNQTIQRKNQRTIQSFKGSFYLEFFLDTDCVS